MTINLQTLKCGECGSGVLRRSGLNQYTCAHCGSVSVVEDGVSDRLERVLEQVKNEAGRRLAADELAQRRRTARVVGITALSVAGMVALVSIFTALFGRKAPPVAAARPEVVIATPRAIPAEGLKLDAPRQVLVGTGSSAKPWLLVMARNETGQALERPNVKAVYFDGESRVGERSVSLPIGSVGVGETTPVLIDLPGDRNVTRQALEVAPLSAPFQAVQGPPLRFARVRLVQQRDNLRLVGRLVNERTDGASLAGVTVLVTLYDDAGAVVGLGRGSPSSSEIHPGERSATDVRIERIGHRETPVAAWDYRIDYSLDGQAARKDHAGRARVVSTARVVRTEGGPEVFSHLLRLGSEDLLADEAERFDTAQLELLPQVAARDTTQDPVYFTEVVNRSTDTIALAPGAVISRYDGSRLDGTTAVSGPAYLYPGERLPVLLEPRGSGRITATRVEWKPMRRAALPGPRVALQVRVTDTRADTSSVLVNFSRRYTYKFVMVSGTVANPSPSIVRKVRLWVSLRDAAGRLSGFTLLENLPAIAPGESVPFEAKVDQFGRDFAKVETLFQSE